MSEINVKIKGVSPLLVNRPNLIKNDTGKKTSVYDPKIESENKVYRDQKIGCYVPSEWIEGCLQNSASDFKLKRKSLKNQVKATVRIEPEKIPLGKEYVIDSRFGKIQRQGIIISRPKFDSWELKFKIIFEENKIAKETLKQILEEAGKTYAIGSYRPKYGRFKIIEFK